MLEFFSFADDGRTKYKVNFEEKGKSLVSGHHIAFDCMPKVQHLVVGSRVVIKCPDNNPPFCPGILAELPSRKNRMRYVFLIIILKLSTLKRNTFLNKMHCLMENLLSFFQVPGFY